MNFTSFEQAFSDFLDGREYDEAQAALFSMARVAFMAGWLAAGGHAPAGGKVVELAHARMDSVDVK